MPIAHPSIFTTPNEIKFSDAPFQHNSFYKGILVPVLEITAVECDLREVWLLFLATQATMQGSSPHLNKIDLVVVDL